MQREFDIKKFTSSVAVYLMNAIAETVEFDMTEVESLSHVYDAFDKLAITMEAKEIGLSDLQNDNPFIQNTARDLLIMINDDKTYKELKDKYNALRDQYVIEQNCDFINMSREELENLGFAYWEDSNPLMLIPIWIYRLLPTELELTSIIGTKAPVFSDGVRVDRPEDIRFGHVGWGFYLK
jgi:hypothetical protein